VFDILTNVLASTKNKWDYQAIIKPLLRRLKSDDELCEMLIKCLLNSPTPSQKATIPRLIGITRNISDIREWCIQEVDNQLGSNAPPEVGVNLFVGELQPVAHSLMEILV